MSSKWSVPHEDLVCPVCQDIFKDPVVLQCSHSFCNLCVTQWWSTSGRRACPFCKAVSPSGAPFRNLVLRNFCDAFLLEVQSGIVCQQHYEKFKLYCLDDQTPVCVVCKHGAQHRDHACVPAEEAANNFRFNLALHLPHYRETVKVFKEAKAKWERNEIRKQAQEAEKTMREEFKVLREFLLLEEEARIGALKEEEELKMKVTNDAIAELSREIGALESTIKSVEEGLKMDDSSFLLKVDSMTKEVLRPLPCAKEPTGVAIDVAKHLGNMSFSVWYKMKEFVSYSPVILDPNTAHQELELSEGLTSVLCGPKLPLSVLAATPDRIHHCVLGREGYASGTHSWDVQVGDNPVWALGVMTRDAQKNRGVQSGLWMLRFSQGKFTAFSPTRSTCTLPLKDPRPKRVKVRLDCDAGRLSFSDLDTDTVIHSFTHAFKEELFPYLNTWCCLPLKILPMKHSVTVTRQ